MSTGEAEDGQWRGYSLRHDFAWFRELCGGAQDLPIEISRSKLIRLPALPLLFWYLLCRLYLAKDIILNNEIDWWYETQSARGENQNRPASGYGTGGPVGGSSSAPNAASTATFHGRSESNNVLSPQGVEGTEHDNGAYGHVYSGVVGTSHNGAGGEPY